MAKRVTGPVEAVKNMCSPKRVFGASLRPL
jgi:hypothetical protein